MVPVFAVPRALLLIIALHCGSGTVNAASGGVTICTCDLSPGSCDINCCCDTDCSTSDPTNVFSFCLPGSTKAESWACISNWLIFRNNTPYTTTLLGTAPADLFCISSADASLNYFVTPQKVDAANFATLSDPYRGASFSPASAGAPAFSSFYRAGDPVLTVSTSGVLGVLRQPAATGAQNRCSDNNPAKFLQNNITSCVRVLRDVTGGCETERSLSPPFYHQDIAVLRVPADATDQNARRIPITSSVTDVPVLRGDVCNNVVTQVIYTVLYNGTQGVTSVSVDFTLSNVSAASAVISQTFSVLYKPVSSASSSVQSRSGNPGYLVGLPVQSDIGRLSLLRSQVGDSCSYSDVQFGVNSLSGCEIRGRNQETCSDLQARAYQLLVGGRAPGSVAMFGNITAGQDGARTPIIYQNCSLQGDCGSSCLIPTSLHVQILWARAGLLFNPQSQVVGARFVFRCQRVQCLDASTLQASVSFTDLTRRGPAPRSTVTRPAPLDFFFPFRSGAAINTPRNLFYPTLSILIALQWAGRG